MARACKLSAPNGQQQPVLWNSIIGHGGGNSENRQRAKADLRMATGRIWTRNQRVSDPAVVRADDFALRVCEFGDPKRGEEGAGLEYPQQVSFADPKSR